MGEKNQTTGDEAGERAERLARIRAMNPTPRGTVPRDVDFLLAELDRVTALEELARGIASDAIASRNAWAEKASGLREALENLDAATRPFWDKAHAVLEFNADERQRAFESGWNAAISDLMNLVRPILAATEEKA